MHLCSEYNNKSYNVTNYKLHREVDNLVINYKDLIKNNFPRKITNYNGEDSLHINRV